KGGVGKTTLVYHVAYMLSELGYKTLAVDLDPQANLTSMFLDEDSLIKIYENEDTRHTILNSIKPLTKGIGDISEATFEIINENLYLIPGDLELSIFEDRLSDNWNKCLNKDELAFRITSSFYRIIQNASLAHHFDYTLIDVGPNLGPINRATLISADYIVVPMAADLFSLQGLKNLGSAISRWKDEWHDRNSRNPEPSLILPKGNVTPIGYIVMQHVTTEGRPVFSYKKWADKIPSVFRKSFLIDNHTENKNIDEDPYCIALIKHYRSLMAMAQEVRKPIFLLKPSDGAIGAHFNAVKQVYKDFYDMTNNIIKKCL
ncbi:MAG: AAA family ATPase, partial [Alphaproteobacteria bacterium]|nr:AAA family ATPase [Alphaproteobacteria bacterium]